MCETSDINELARCHTRLRRRFDAIYFGFACLCLAIGGLVCWIWDDRESLNLGLFAAAMALLGLLYNHFVLFNPYRDPIETQRRLERLAERHRRAREWWW